MDEDNDEYINRRILDTRNKIFQQYMEFEAADDQNNNYQQYNESDSQYYNQMPIAPQLNFNFESGLFPQIKGKLKLLFLFIK